MTTFDMPTIDEVYFHHTYDRGDAKAVATQGGFKWYTWGSQATAHHVSNSSSYPVADIENNKGTNLLDLQTKVIEYLAKPERSQRATSLQNLERHGFFSALSYGEAVRRLELVLSTSCKGGAARAREFLGDLLPKPKPTTKKLEITLELEVEHPCPHFGETSTADYGLVPKVVQYLQSASLEVNNPLGDETTAKIVSSDWQAGSYKIT